MFDNPTTETTSSKLLDNMNLIGVKELRIYVKDNNLEVTVIYADNTVEKLKSKTSDKSTIKILTAVKDWTYNFIGIPWSVIISVYKKLERHIDNLSLILPYLVGLFLKLIDKMTFINQIYPIRIFDNNSHLKIRN
ncbi:putative SP-containing protein [Vairimorpha necatrix]|uniref:SP-containing protein n=1 Tax=Vairimorpha necatrix TaxID=6039 RepID=A0AAX4JGF5_9MICR